jgi:hypothetical protein
MVSASLVPHPQTPCPLVRAIDVHLLRPSDALLRAQYVVTGEVLGLAIPAATTPLRADGLWRHTCCELFVRRADAAHYFEFNLSPSSRWAAYAFASYRHDMTPVALDREPTIVTELGDDTWQLDAEIHLPDELAHSAADSLAVACTMVVETTATALSYWALAHAPGPPDFHHATGFVLRI